MNIKDYLGQTANAIKRGNAISEVVIMPKFMKAGFYRKEGFNPVDLAVLMAIYEHVNTDTGHCYPKQATLAEMIGTDRQATISESMTRLEKFGLIHKVPAKIGKNGRLVKTTNEIIVTPFDKINDEAYHKGLEAEIERIKYIVVGYNNNSTTREIIGTGEKNNSKTEAEVNKIRQERAQEARNMSNKSVIAQDTEDTYYVDGDINFPQKTSIKPYTTNAGREAPF